MVPRGASQTGGGCRTRPRCLPQPWEGRTRGAWERVPTVGQLACVCVCVCVCQYMYAVHWNLYNMVTLCAGHLPIKATLVGLPTYILMELCKFSLLLLLTVDHNSCMHSVCVHVAVV